MLKELGNYIRPIYALTLSLIKLTIGFLNWQYFQNLIFLENKLLKNFSIEVILEYLFLYLSGLVKLPLTFKYTNLSIHAQKLSSWFSKSQYSLFEIVWFVNARPGIELIPGSPLCPGGVFINRSLWFWRYCCETRRLAGSCYLKFYFIHKRVAGFGL